MSLFRKNKAFLNPSHVAMDFFKKAIKLVSNIRCKFNVFKVKKEKNMTQTLKKMMLLAFVFAIASAAPKMNFKQAVSSIDAKLRPHFTIRTDKGFKGGLSGAKGLIAMLVLNRMVANNATGVEAVKNAVLGLKGTASAYGSGVKSRGLSKAAVYAALVSPVVTGAKGTYGFATSFLTDMNPFGKTLENNQAQIDDVKAENSRKDALPNLVARPAVLLTDAQDAAERELNLGAEPALSEFAGDATHSAQEQLDAALAARQEQVRVARHAAQALPEIIQAQVEDRAAQKVHSPLPVFNEQTNFMFFHKQVGAPSLNYVPTKADVARSLMAYLTIASTVYAAVNTVRDWNDARLAKKAKAAELEKASKEVA